MNSEFHGRVKNFSLISDSFLAFVEIKGSVRLRNLLQAAADNPDDYNLRLLGKEESENILQRGFDDFPSYMLRIPNMGKKTASELFDLVKHYSETNFIESAGDAFVPERESINFAFTDAEFIDFFEENVSRNVSDTFKEIIAYQQYSLTDYYSFAALSDTEKFLKLTSELGLNSFSAKKFISIIRLYAAKLTTESRQGLKRAVQCEVENKTIEERIFRGVKGRDLIVFQGRFTKNKKTLEELGEELGITRERVRQIEKKISRYISLELSLAPIEKIAEIIRKEEPLIFSNEFLLKSQLRQKSKSFGDGLAILSIDWTVFDKAMDIAYTKFMSCGETLSGWFVHPDMAPNMDEFTPHCHDADELETLIDSIAPMKVEESEKFGIPKVVFQAYITSNASKYRIIRVGMDSYIFNGRPSYYDKARFVLREVDKPLHHSDISQRIEELFGDILSDGQMTTVLGAMDDVTPTERGWFALYESLEIDENMRRCISDLAVAYLLQRGRYISSKVIFREIKEDLKNIDHGARVTNSYLLHGIVQDDERFLTKPGLMVGLYEKNFREISLDDDIIELMRTLGHPLTVKEIIRGLSDVRDLIEQALFNMLEAQNDKYEKVGSNSYFIKGQDPTYETLSDVIFDL